MVEMLHQGTNDYGKLCHCLMIDCCWLSVWTIPWDWEAKFEQIWTILVFRHHYIELAKHQEAHDSS